MNFPKYIILRPVLPKLSDLPKKEADKTLLGFPVKIDNSVPEDEIWIQSNGTTLKVKVIL
jgi:hypothetical protein